MAKPINEILQSEFITHQHYIERYKNSEIKRLLLIMRKAEEELRQVILVSPNVSSLTKAKQNELLSELMNIQKIYNKEFEETITSDMNSLGTQEIQYYANGVDTALNNIEVNLSTSLISPEKLEAVIKRTSMILDSDKSVTVSEFLKTFTQSNVSIVRSTVRNGFLLGRTNKQIVSNLFGTHGRYLKSLNDAKAVTRTMVMHYANTAREQFYQNNTDIIKGYQWISTLDGRTTDICRYRDGRVWYYNSPENSTLPGQVTPPAHYACRSTTSPIVKSFRELGFDRDEIPLGTRSSLNGYVPADTTYYQWFNDLDSFVVNPNKIRKDILGPVRFDLWQKNKLKIENFYTNDGRMLSLDQLSDRNYKISNQYKHYITEGE